MLRGDGLTPMPFTEMPLFRALQGESVLRTELVIAPPTGTLRRFLANASPLNDAHGTRTGAVLVLHDITELAKAQQALADADKSSGRRRRWKPSGSLPVASRMTSTTS